jgi:hypothetical protein
MQGLMDGMTWRPPMRGFWELKRVSWMMRGSWGGCGDLGLGKQRTAWQVGKEKEREVAMDAEVGHTGERL